MPLRHSWIVDVLSDLQTYARQNGLPRLAEQVDQTLRVAHEEIARDQAQNPPH